MAIQIYGTPTSRARRPLWVARELGIDIELITPAAGETKQAPYLAINPNGKVPAMRDGTFQLFESFAISLYLARKYGSDGATPLYPASIEQEALTWQWMLWTANELESPVTACVIERLFRKPEDQDKARADAAEATSQRLLAILDGAFRDRDWLIADHFTVGDIIVASVVALAELARIDVSAYPAVDAWLRRCQARPSYG